MLHGASKNYVIRFLYGRCMRLIYHDKTSSYKELLPNDDLVYIHHKNSHINLAIELYKVKNEPSREIVSNIFCLQNQSKYNLQQ